MSTAKLPVAFRLYHWCLAVVFLLNTFILEEGDPPHRYLGYFICALVVLAISFQKKRQVEHYNSKARFVYWGIWATIIGLGVTGFMMGLDAFWGNDTLEDVHELISNGLSVLIVIHLAGVFFDAYQNKRRTWMVMISGEKE